MMGRIKAVTTPRKTNTTLHKTSTTSPLNSNTMLPLLSRITRHTVIKGISNNNRLISSTVKEGTIKDRDKDTAIINNSSSNTAEDRDTTKAVVATAVLRDMTKDHLKGNMEDKVEEGIITSPHLIIRVEVVDGADLQEDTDRKMELITGLDDDDGMD